MPIQDTQDTIAGIIVLIIGIGVAALILIFVGALGGQTYSIVESDIDAVYATSADQNESFIADNTSWVSLDNAEILNGTVGINAFNWTVRNSTSWEYVTTNFTLNLTDGTILLHAGVSHTSPDLLDGSTCYITYNYKNRTIRTYLRSSIISSFFALRTTGNYLPIIVLAVIITLILGLIVGLTGLTTGYSGMGKGGYSGGAL